MCAVTCFLVSNIQVQSEHNNNPQNITSVQNGFEVVHIDDQTGKGYQKFCETSSETCSIPVKPKIGVFKKINSLLTRMFTTRL